MPMIKFKKQIKDDEVDLIDLLRPESFEALYRITGKHYSREKVQNEVRVERAEKPFSFWDKLMRSKPGFDKGDR